MPPKSPVKARTKSPVKSAVQSAAKAPAGSKAVAKAAAASVLSVGKKPTATATPLPSSAPSGSSPAKTAPPAVSNDAAARRVQRTARAFTERAFLGRRLSKKVATALAARSEQRLLRQVQFERARATSEQRIAGGAAAAHARSVALQEQLCVACFEGDMALIGRLLAPASEGKGGGASAHKKDPDGNVPLGEAAVNGQTDVVRLLCSEPHCCNPNARGQFERTPLWRAAFNSHAPAVQALLEFGADPRLSAQAQLPEDLGSAETKALIRGWDPAKTAAAAAAIERRQAARDAAKRAEDEREASTHASAVAEAQARHRAAQQSLLHARQEFERRVCELDLVTTDPAKAALRDVALGAVREAEATIAARSEEAEAACHRYLDAKASCAAHAQQSGLAGELPGMEVTLRQFAEHVIADAENRYKATPKWPLVIDTTEKVRVFLRYRDTNVLDAIHPHQMRPESVRMAVLGSLRYGKPLVVDLRDVPMLDAAKTAFNAVAPTLWADVMSKAIAKPEVFKSLIKASDGEQYALNRFSQTNLSEFVVIVLTSALAVEDELIELYFPFRVVDE